MEAIRSSIVAFIKTLTSFDYMGFIIAFFLFVIFLVLALMLRKKSKRAAILAIFAFLSLFGAPIAMHMLVKSTLFKSRAELESVKKLYYSDTLLIKGLLHYEGKYDAKHCTVAVAVYKVHNGFIKDLANKIKPYKKGFCILDRNFTKGDITDFKVVIEPYLYEGDYNLSLKTECTI